MSRPAAPASAAFRAAYRAARLHRREGVAVLALACAVLALACAVLRLAAVAVLAAPLAPAALLAF